MGSTLQQEEGQAEIERDMEVMFGIASKGETGVVGKRGVLSSVLYNDIDDRQCVRKSTVS